MKDEMKRYQALLGNRTHQTHPRFRGFPRIAKEEIEKAREDSFENPDMSPNQLLRVRRRRDAVAQMVLHGFPIETIIEVVEKKFDLADGTRAVRRDIKEIRNRWLEEDNENRANWRSEAIRRIYGHIRESAKDRDWKAVTGFERLLAQIQGTLGPIRIDVNKQHAEDLLEYLGCLGPEDIERYAKKFEDLERKAELYDGLVITTVGKSIS